MPPRTGTRCARTGAPSCAFSALRGGREPGRGPRLHPGRRVAMARVRRGPPAARSQYSMYQPRRRAMAASLVSGFTTTGKPEASSMGRSLVESAYPIVSARLRPSERAYSSSRIARASPVGGDSVSSPVSLPLLTPMCAQTISSNKGRRGSTTKSSAPVMSRVRWPSALWRRTRARASGNARRPSRSLKSS